MPLPNAKLKPIVKDGSTVVGNFTDNEYEFHMHYYPPENWQCNCYIMRRIRKPFRGMSSFAPDDFEKCTPLNPLIFEDYGIASKWWNKNKDIIVKSINSGTWMISPLAK